MVHGCRVHGCMHSPTFTAQPPTPTRRPRPPGTHLHHGTTRHGTYPRRPGQARHISGCPRKARGARPGPGSQTRDPGTETRGRTAHFSNRPRPLPRETPQGARRCAPPRPVTCTHPHTTAQRTPPAFSRAAPRNVRGILARRGTAARSGEGNAVLPVACPVSRACPWPVLGRVLGVSHTWPWLVRCVCLACPSLVRHLSLWV